MVTLKVVVMLSITGLFSILNVMFVMLLKKRLSIPKPQVTVKIDIPIHLSNIAVMACVSDSIIWTDRKSWWLHIWLLTEIAYKLLHSRHVSQFVLTFLILVSPIHRAKRLSVISLSILHQTLRDSMKRASMLF